MTDIVERLGRRIHNQRVRLRYWEELFNEHVHAHLHALHPRHLKKAIELGNENFRLRQLLSEAEKREAEARAKAVEDVLSALTAHELYQYRPKAFQGFIDYVRSTVANSEESPFKLACAAYDLAAWAGSINWRGGENQKEWLDELRQHIETVQSLCKPYRSAIRALQSEER